MSLDTKYRPRKYRDLMGQDGTVLVLRQFVATGAGHHQSYLFAGPKGCGKTSTGRILARALLCDNPVGGDPCDQCPSCRAMLELETVAGYTEVDAANNSGKADMQRVTEEIQYATFDGKRRIYLFDEAHRLSSEAKDAMLKPLEENVPGSEEKRLVCIFCTTEPEKMPGTIMSRCAPTFFIRKVAPAVMAERLAWVCQQEGFEFDPAVLPLVAEVTGCHFRDALKAIEGVSRLGAVSRANVDSYLMLDLHAVYLDMLESIGADLPKALQAAETALTRVSPLSCYERLAEAAMMAYKVFLGVEKSPAYWDAERVQALGQRLGDGLLVLAQRFASRPGRPSSAMLLCDIAAIHKFGATVTMPQVVVVPAPVQAPISAPVPLESATSPAPETSQAPRPAPESSGEVAPNPAPRVEPQVPRTSAAKTSSGGGTLAKAPPSLKATAGVYVAPGGVGHREDVTPEMLNPTEPRRPATLGLDPAEFSRLLGLHLASLDEAERGPTG